MPTARTQAKSIYLVGGDDEYSIKEAAAKLAEKLAPKKGGEFGVEIIDGDAATQDSARQVFDRLREAVDTVGLFGAEKVVWLKSTNLLGDNVVTRTESVKDLLVAITEFLKRGLPAGVTLLISAIGCDRRKSLFKVIEKMGEVKILTLPEAGKDQGEEVITALIQKKLRVDGKTMTAEAFDAFRALVAPDPRELVNELEKLCLYVGERSEIHQADVRAICSASRQAEIWDLTEALGRRHLPKAIAELENLLGAGEQPLGVLAMLVAQFRLTLLARDLMDRRILAASEGKSGGFQFVREFDNLPERETAHFPRNKDGKLPNSWRFYRCALVAKNFTVAELIRALDRLLEANRLLVSTQLDPRLVLEEALAKIARQQPG